VVNQGRIWVAGGSGLVGSSLVRRLSREKDLTVLAPTRLELDLFDIDSIERFLIESKPDTVILAAAKVGGIGANIAHPVKFLTENLAIQNNVMVSAVTHGVSTIMFLGSSCIYPRECPQPMREQDYMTGALEPTNESYAVAKIAGMRLAQALREETGVRILLPLPCNVYGPGDHFDLANSHVLSALVAKFETARRQGDNIVSLWGTGSAQREFIHCDDLADACLFLLTLDQDLGLVNVGTGIDQSIAELANLIAQRVGFQGTINWDETKPDGMPRKVLDVNRLTREGWQSKVALRHGIDTVVSDYRTRYPDNSE
jgi:GDP-L-fucose synthase